MSNDRREAAANARAPSLWRWPSALALAMVVGLTSALLGDGPWDALSWIALAGPLVVAGIASRRATR